MDVPINIPVKRHFYKFLVHHWGENYRLTTTDFLGCFIFHLLKRQNTWNPKSSGYNPDIFPCRYTVIIPDTYYFNQRINNITPRSIQQFNTFLDSLFQFTFINSTECRLEDTEMEKKRAYELFIDQINLEEVDLSFDALKKDHYRYRKRKSVLS